MVQSAMFGHFLPRIAEVEFPQLVGDDGAVDDATKDEDARLIQTGGMPVTWHRSRR